MVYTIEQLKDRIAPVALKYNLTAVYLFGSYAKGKATEDSDDDIAAAIKRFGDSFEAFSNDTDFYNSISMSIMQIGELSGGLSEGFKDSTRTQMPWGLMKGMRNHFAHGYATMDRSDIWETATKDIPNVLRFCEKVIEKNALESGRATKPRERDSR